ncbi:MAG: NADAR family protein [Kordiimonadaceae bacterium]|nr:NADAR family protein [Kordiimonadaceae bacterium]
MAIFFNTRTETHPEFRTTSAHSITLGDEQWPTVEHYVLAQRFECKNLQAEVRSAPYAFEAKALARQHPNALRNDWEKIRDDVMETAIREKFKQHPCLQHKLAATEGQELIEASACSNYWGAGSNGTGKNKLGRILMKIRDELRNSFQAYGRASSGVATENRLG